MQFKLFRKEFIVVVFVLTAIFGTIYAVAQQALRQDANDPQVELAQDISSALVKNNQPSVFENATKVDIATSLSPFLAIADSTGKIVVTTGQLDNQAPTIPQGVFDAAKKTGENRITWQPKKGVRVALVVASYDKGFVAVGRSLKEVESRTQALFNMVAVAWAVTLLVSVVLMRTRRA